MSAPLSDAERIFTDRYSAGVAHAFAFIVVGWHVGNDLPATIASGPHPVALITWLAYAAVAAVGVPLVLRGRSAGPLLTGAGCVVLLAGSAAMHAIQPDSLFVFTNWAWQAAGWLALPLFWNRAVQGFLVFVVANAALSIAALLTRGDSDRQDLAMMLMVLYGVAALQLALDVGKRGLETIALRTARDRAAAEALLTARLAADQAHEARQDRYASARAAAGGVLAGLADGHLDPDDPEVRQRAAGAAARLRRLVTETDDVPDPLVHALRAAADVAERRGVAVTVDQVGNVPDVPLQVRRALTDAPAWAVAAAATRARITVVSNVHTVTIAVVGDGSIDQPRWDQSAPDSRDGSRSVAEGGDGVEVSVDREGEQIWVEARWSSAPSGSQMEAQLESPSSTTTRSSSTGSGPGPLPTPRDGSTWS